MDRSDAVALDAEDPLSELRDRFLLPQGSVYLDGNSLGAMPDGAAEVVFDVVELWRTELIGGWNADWVDLSERTAAQVAPLLGASPTEVAVADSTSVNLFKALTAAGGLRPDRNVILLVDGEFPTDVYIAGGIAELTGLTVRTTSESDLDEALDHDVGVLLRSHVDYRTGRRTDLEAWTAHAHEVGAVTVWDLSHSVGALDLRLDECEVDLAVGCSYKFLNGGPGAPAWIFAARRHHEGLATALRGWFGHAEPFAFGDRYVPAPDAKRFQNGTPPILSLALLHHALKAWQGVELPAVERKAGRLTDLFIRLVDDRCPELEIASPRDAGARGAQVSLRHPGAGPMIRALKERGVVGDHRPPDILRFGFAPLYIRFVDVWDAVDRLAAISEAREWADPAYAVEERVP